MSSQQSTVDSLKDTASSTYDSVANTVSSSQNLADYNPHKDPQNFDKDAHGNTFKKGDFKDQLNRAATGDLDKRESPTEGLLDKVKAYIPGFTPQNNDPKEEKTPVNPDQPPARPDHDVQVEQFLRKQYHSTAGDGMPNPDDK